MVARAQVEDREKSRIRHKIWRAKNPDKARAHSQGWKKRNPDSVRLTNLRARSRPDKLFQMYALTAERKGLSFALTYEDFLRHWAKPCYYCGDEIKTCGLDRVDNNQGYHRENVVPCCSLCNFAKRQSSQRDFILRCHKIAARHPAGVV